SRFCLARPRRHAPRLLPIAHRHARARARGGVNRGFGTRRARDADEMPFPCAISRVNVSVFFRSCTD
ncbi:hypothetical protein, partial [Burkholderia pseudomallei]|uniref:hypothetical protein n=1 Tax=Burkholderia pseudomallei TaxID=28450 RepID=UPI001C9E8D64